MVEKDELTLVQIIQEMVQRINNIECSLGYIIKTLDIPPPQELVKE